MNTNIFHTARIKLTMWYLLILMIISMIFSVVVFYSLDSELRREARREQQRIVADQLKIVLPKPLPDPNELRKELVDPPLSPEIRQNYLNSRNELILRLFFVNFILLLVSASLSYLLAGKTLSPIESMLEDQKKFISDASHELRTPLTSLKTATEVTLKMGETPYENIKSMLESNLEDINNLENLTNRILSIEKFSRHTKNESFSTVYIDDLVENCVNELEKKANVHGIQIVRETIPVQLIANERGLHEMIVNLIDNAVKYSKPNREVFIKVSKEKDIVCIQVKDNGIGINSSDIPHIFERFYRSDQARSKSGVSGYGLGLSITREVVKQHDGEIKVESEVGKGSVFTVKLPMKSDMNKFKLFLRKF